MKGLMGKVLLAVAGAGLVVGALTVSGVARPVVVAQDRGPRDVQRNRVVIDGLGASIGVTVRDVSAEEGQRAKLSPPQGAYVTRVERESPAQKAGIMTGDIIVEFDGEHVRSARQLSRLVRESADGRSVRSTVVRDGSRRTVDITPESDRSITMPDLSRLSEQMRDLAQRFEFRYDGPGGRGPWVGGARGRLGVSLQSVGDQLASYFGVQRGALVTSVDMDSPAGRAGLKAGDVITSVNGRPVDTPADVLEAVRRADDGGSLAITLVRDRKELKLEAKMPERARPAIRSGRPI